MPELAVSPRHQATKARLRPRKIFAAIGVSAVSGLLVVVLVIGFFALCVPAFTGSLSYAILTSSMKPSLPPGTFVVVQPTPADALRVGDIVTYQLVSGKPAVVTHRITAVSVDSAGSRAFTTRGDNNAVADAKPVRAEQIKGRVWYAIPYLGWVSTFRSTIVGGAIISMIGWLLLVYGLVHVSFVAVTKHRRRTLQRSD
ncbi:signal peptidase I [Leifsonia sp. NPDC102414]|uniref:signal peptidase I n=1 Tax=Leifsonia sp. NPDC102414 TaxID=3364124 RepID=UPI00382ABB00